MAASVKPMLLCGMDASQEVPQCAGSEVGPIPAKIRSNAGQGRCESLLTFKGVLTPSSQNSAPQGPGLRRPGAVPH
eukprot:scaffold1199_cov265-Pinguiococcus_pyrenoidosus.AAC.17